MSERNLEIIREYHFDPKEVIKGLNGYYESDKCNSYIYITIRRNDVECPAYCTAALYLSALIEWLRVDHDIFYRPGLKLDQVEAARSAAKMCGLRAHIKDEISKRGLRCDKDADIPALVDTLFKAYDEEGERADKNRADAVKLSKENRELKEGVCEDIMGYIRYEASQNGFELPVFHDLLEPLRKRDTERIHTYDAFCDILEALGVSRSHTFNLDIHELKNKAIQRASLIKSEHDRYLEQLEKAAADYQALSEKNQEFKIELNTLRDIVSRVRSRLNKKFCPLGYETDLEKLADIALRAVEARDEKINRITKPWHDECEDTKELKEQKDRAAAILQDLYRDIFHKDCTQFTYEDIATKILNRVLETEDLLHKSVDSVNKECKAVGKQMVDDYEKDLLRFIYKEYRGRIHLSDHTITYNPPSVRNTVLKIISDYARSRTRVDILETRIKSIFDRCKAKFTVDDYVLNGDPTTSFMLDCISSWIDSPAPRDGWTNCEIENLRGQISRLKGLINAMNEEVKDM